MGYYTQYALTVMHTETEDPDTLYNNIRQELSDAYGYVGLFGDYEGEFGSDTKWYEHENNVRAISKKYRDTLIVLEGIGEASGDMWRKYFYNGKMQNAPALITYASFDMEKLR